MSSSQYPVEKIFLSPKSSNNAQVFLSGRGHEAASLSFSDQTHEVIFPANIAFLTDVNYQTTIGYIYSILHSHKYRQRYAEYLAIDFPRIPLPQNQKTLQNLAYLGNELIKLHLMESPTIENPITTYKGSKYPDVNRVGWSDGVVWLDATKTDAKEGHRATKPGKIGFHGVTKEVWGFHVGGYQVCHKWLKDRKGRTLSEDEIAHYQKIIVAINETIRIMGEIDEVIEKHGGWPGAFQTAQDSE